MIKECPFLKECKDNCKIIKEHLIGRDNYTIRKLKCIRGKIIYKWFISGRNRGTLRIIEAKLNPISAK